MIAMAEEHLRAPSRRGGSVLWVEINISLLLSYNVMG
jgi:hypothetical protein